MLSLSQRVRYKSNQHWQILRRYCHASQKRLAFFVNSTSWKRSTFICKNNVVNYGLTQKKILKRSNRLRTVKRTPLISLAYWKRQHQAKKKVWAKEHTRGNQVEKTLYIRQHLQCHHNIFKKSNVGFITRRMEKKWLMLAASVANYAEWHFV